MSPRPPRSPRPSTSRRPRTSPGRRTTPGRPRAWGREAGFALPLVMGFLVALAIVAGTAALTTQTDLRIVGATTGARRASTAAASALEHAAAVFRESGPENADAWPVTGTLDGYDYAVSLDRDSADLGHGVAPTWYDPAGSAPAANTDGRGEPIYVLRAHASRDPYRATARLWISEAVGVRIPAALSVNSRGVTLGEAHTVSGLNVGPDGVPVDPGDRATTGACAENRPAVHLSVPRGPVLSRDATLSGNEAYASGTPPYTDRGPGPAWEGPADVLGRASLPGRSETILAHQSHLPDELSGLTWIEDRVGGLGGCLSRAGCTSLQGSGILLVHNPRYDPREHDPTDPRYDPHRAADPRYAPAEVRDLEGGTFRGLVIVDQLPPSGTGGFRIHGALVVLRSGRRWGTEWDEEVEVRYACEALVEAARSAGLGPERLGWSDAAEAGEGP